MVPDSAARERAQRTLGELAEHLRCQVAAQGLTVGLSGGADSTLALAVAVTLRERDERYRVRAVHCIHGLDAGDPLWLAHCRQLCRTWHVELLTPRLQIACGARRSLEDTARQARYAALCSHSLPPGCLILGHHADDQVETILLALKRGSGPQGLSGMQAVTADRRGLVCRPLLGLRKTEIVALLDALGVSFVSDESNACLRFERNFLRLQVLPLLRRRFGGIDRALLRVGRLCATEHDLARRYVQERASTYIDGLTLNFAALDLRDEAFCTMLLREFLARLATQPPPYSLVSNLYELLRGGPDQQAEFEFGGYMLRRYRQLLLAERPCALSVPEGGEVQLRWGERVQLGEVSYELVPCSDEDIEHGFFMHEGETLRLRFAYAASLLLWPRTRQHRRSVRKLFGEHHIPPHRRRLQPLVINAAGDIVALGEVLATRSEPGSMQGGRLVRLRIGYRS